MSSSHDSAVASRPQRAAAGHESSDATRYCRTVSSSPRRPPRGRTASSSSRVAAWSTTVARSAPPSSSQRARHQRPKARLLGPQLPPPPRSKIPSWGAIASASGRRAGASMWTGVARAGSACGVGSGPEPAPRMPARVARSAWSTARAAIHAQPRTFCPGHGARWARSRSSLSSGSRPVPQIASLRVISASNASPVASSSSARTGRARAFCRATATATSHTTASHADCTKLATARPSRLASAGVSAAAMASYDS
mmetsp:Transcript_28187/g.94701  ORF Transcript_28187/g.94701 Transcript_28187/m.94701 type:complete len:254 (-) Transcript_28187:357-1118(-)